MRRNGTLALTLLVGVLVVFALGACSTKGAGIPVANLPGDVAVKELERDEYTILQQATGRDCAQYIGLWPLPIWFVKSDELGTKAFTFSGTEKTAMRGAIYRTLENAPGADFLTAPRVKLDFASGFIWYSQTCVDITARAAALKNDDELAKKDKVDLELRISKEKE